MAGTVNLRVTSTKAQIDMTDYASHRKNVCINITVEHCHIQKLNTIHILWTCTYIFGLVINSCVTKYYQLHCEHLRKSHDYFA